LTSLIGAHKNLQRNPTDGDKFASRCTALTLQFGKSVLGGDGTTSLVMPLVAAVACGLLIGIERGWRQRAEPDGTRVAGVRTFTLIATAGGLAAILAQTLSIAMAMIATAGLTTVLAAAFLRQATAPRQRDATTVIAAFVALLLGLVAGAGQPALAVAGAALVTLLLVTREQSHRLLSALTSQELHAFAFLAVISIAVLPFLPNRDFGPYLAWNPFKLWLVVVLIIGFSVLGYAANRIFGEGKGTIATALIGGAYSSTAVTASLSAQLGGGESGPLATGIALASAVMYVRVLILTAILAPVVASELTTVLGPATLVAWIASAVVWRIERSTSGSAKGKAAGKPFRFLPALGFAVAVAAAALLVRWAQTTFGEVGAAMSLFLAGSFDVDAAIVTLSTLPGASIAPAIAAVVLGGTVAVNMGFKAAVLFANAKWRMGRLAVSALSTSQIVLLLTLAWQLGIMT
jgi:uncharacterized membrane protein (DUF4010 family)